MGLIWPIDFYKVKYCTYPKKKWGQIRSAGPAVTWQWDSTGLLMDFFSYLSVSIHIFFHFSESKVALKKAESTKDDSSKKPVCTTESGASPNLPCIFPFRFNGVTHTTCIWDMAHLTEHKPWCSTLVDEVGHHVGGQSKWGNCGPDCPIPPDTRNETTAVPGRTSFF